MQQPTKPTYIAALRFRWLTPYYDAVVRATTRERRFKLALVSQARFEPGQRVLDLAAGTGTLAIWIKQRYPQTEVIGVDGDLSVLAIASRKAQAAAVTVQFDRALSDSLPYPDAHFDRVVSTLFFHHLSPQSKRLTAREVFRVMKPGAELHIADWGRASNPLMRALFVFIQLLDGFENTAENVSHGLIGVFEDAGFFRVTARQSFSTVFGTMTLYSAIKPSQ